MSDILAKLAILSDNLASAETRMVKRSEALLWLKIVFFFFFIRGKK